MSNITQLTDKHGNNIYPVTSDTLVIDSDGKNVKSKIDSINSQMEAIQNQVGDLSNLNTVNKGNLVDVINELLSMINNSPNIPVSSVTLSPSNHTFTDYTTLQLTANILPSDATNKNVTWSSSNTNVATVSNGLVTAKANGNCTITVRTNDGNKTSTCSITVNKEEVPEGAYVTLSPTVYTITDKILTVQFTTNKTVKGVKLNLTGDTTNFPYTATSYTQTSATFDLSSEANGEYSLRIQVAY